jgi:hypothetical protein
VRVGRICSRGSGDSQSFICEPDDPPQAARPHGKERDKGTDVSEKGAEGEAQFLHTHVKNWNLIFSAPPPREKNFRTHKAAPAVLNRNYRSFNAAHLAIHICKVPN